MKREPFWLGMLALAAASVYVGHYRSRPVEAPPPVIVLEPAPAPPLSVAGPEPAPPPPVVTPVARVSGPPSCDCGIRPASSVVIAKSKPRPALRTSR